MTRNASVLHIPYRTIWSFDGRH